MSRGPKNGGGKADERAKAVQRMAHSPTHSLQLACEIFFVLLRSKMTSF